MTRDQPIVREWEQLSVQKQHRNWKRDAFKRKDEELEALKDTQTILAEDFGSRFPIWKPKSASNTVQTLLQALQCYPASLDSQWTPEEFRSIFKILLFFCFVSCFFSLFALFTYIFALIYLSVLCLFWVYSLDLIIFSHEWIIYLIFLVSFSNHLLTPSFFLLCPLF